jgi:hypothetical protein
MIPLALSTYVGGSYLLDAGRRRMLATAGRLSQHGKYLLPARTEMIPAARTNNKIRQPDRILLVSGDNGMGGSDTLRRAISALGP